MLNHFHYCIVSFYRSFLLSSCGAMWSGRERWGRVTELAMAADLQSILHKEIFSLESSKWKNNHFWFSTLDYSFSHKVVKHKTNYTFSVIYIRWWIFNLYTAMFLKCNVWKAKAVWEKTSCRHCSLKINRIILNVSLNLQLHNSKGSDTFCSLPFPAVNVNWSPFSFNRLYNCSWRPGSWSLTTSEDLLHQSLDAK